MAWLTAARTQWTPLTVWYGVERPTVCGPMSRPALVNASNRMDRACARCDQMSAWAKSAGSALARASRKSPYAVPAAPYVTEAVGGASEDGASASARAMSLSASRVAAVMLGSDACARVRGRARRSLAMASRRARANSGVRGEALGGILAEGGPEHGLHEWPRSGSDLGEAERCVINDLAAHRVPLW